jgi:hypothetical protein
MAESFNNHISQVRYVDYNLVDTCLDQGIPVVFDQTPRPDFEQRLGNGIGQRREALASSGCEYHCRSDCHRTSLGVR